MYQLTTQYTLNFPNVICQFYLNKTGGKNQRSHSGKMSPKLALSLTEKSENKIKQKTFLPCSYSNFKTSKVLIANEITFWFY